MKDIIRFHPTDLPSWTSHLGFTTFTYYKHLNIAFGGDEDKHLKALSNPSTHILTNTETVKTQDKHHWRSSGLNHILLNLAKKNNVAIGFNINTLLECRGKDRATLLGRMMQNVAYCRSYHIPMVICTLAKTPWDLRNASDLLSLGTTLGMTAQEARQALNYHPPAHHIRLLTPEERKTL